VHPPEYSPFPDEEGSHSKTGQVFRRTVDESGTTKQSFKANKYTLMDRSEDDS